MKLFIALLVVVATVQAKVLPSHTAYGYLERSAAEFDKRREAEERFLSSRIVGGVAAGAGQYPYQAGLLIDLVGISGNAVCGATLISPSRLVTAAHCWYDGRHQAWRFTVILGSVTLFQGGIRIQTSAMRNHPNWFPQLARNDIGVIYLSSNVAISNLIAPVALPSGAELLENFVGSTAIASGFGLTSDSANITTSQYLSHVSLNVITNSVCGYAFPFILQPSNLCTSGVGGVGACRGDSGGPLVVTRNNRRILIGATSFGSALGCTANLPSVFARITYFIDFINQHL
ncbi:unnamed protein product [Chilo suppressalis]|uniref:Peptidase S1 domain-containing protein n=1 Tax=Chilo suppressalis TaxID=168631 RepID=A0ABN8AYD2_CHISP|nr:unnamed protein product [Chilo suppressalis]